jgi:8-amino-3,8-dideoxy-alpha-D-manno-octulosonate transaminase
MLLESEARAKTVVERMQAAGLDTAVRLAEYGMHIYFNIPQLVSQTPLSKAGNPWNLLENRDHLRDYHQGACPRSDALFARSILLPIPSRLTPAQEDAAAAIIREAVS